MMSVEDDKAFEDQIERMKQKNQYILEKFKASEEDRKNAENLGATIKKDQNISIRLKHGEGVKMRNNNKLNTPRPRSYHGKVHYDDQNQNYSYNQYHEYRKPNTFRNTKFHDDQVAYQDYMHFQQTYSSNKNGGNNFNNFNRSINRQNSNPNYMDDHFAQQKPIYQDFNRFQNLRNKNVPQRFTPNNYQSNKISPKENYFYQHNYQHSKVNKDNDFHALNYSRAIYKENESQNYKSNAQNTKEPFHRSYNSDSNKQFYKRTSKSKGKLNNGKPVVDGSGDSIPNANKKSSFDDEYIDDTLEDLEQYRLKVDMEDFIVIDPESPDPILAMPLKPWTNDIMPEIDENKTDTETKHNEHHTSNGVLDSKLIPTKDDVRANTNSTNSLEKEFSLKTNISDENVENQFPNEKNNGNDNLAQVVSLDVEAEAERNGDHVEAVDSMNEENVNDVHREKCALLSEDATRQEETNENGGDTSRNNIPIVESDTKSDAK